MRETQYTRILKALRKAGNKGCTVRDLLQFTNYPSARLFELEQNYRETHVYGRSGAYVYGQVTEKEIIERHERQHNGRAIRVYVLKRVK